MSGAGKHPKVKPPNLSNVGQAPSWTNYENPATWNPVVVGGGPNLVTNTGQLRQWQNTLTGVVTTLQGAVIAASPAGAAAAAIAHANKFGWKQASALSTAVSDGHKWISQFSSGLAAAHGDTANAMGKAADTLDSAENANTASAKTLLDIQTAWDKFPNTSGSSNTPNPLQGATLVAYGGGGTASQDWAAGSYRSAQYIADHTPGGYQQMYQESWPYQKDVASKPFPASDAPEVQPDQLSEILNPDDAATIQEAASQYDQLYHQLTTAAGTLQGIGTQIAQNWQGSTALSMVNKVQSLYQTAQSLQQNTYSLKSTLQWYGGVLGAFANSVKKDFPALPATATSAQKADQASAAQEYLRELGTYMGTAYSNLPPTVKSTVKAAPVPTSPPTSHSPGGSGRSGVGNAGVGGSGSTGGSGGGQPPGVTVPGVPPSSTPGVPPSSTPGGNGSTPISVASTPPPTTTTPTTTTPTTTTPTTTTPTTTVPAIPPVTIPSDIGSSSGLGNNTGIEDNPALAGDTADSGLVDVPGLGGLGSSGLLNSGSGAGDGIGGVGSSDSTGLAGDTAVPAEDSVGFPGMPMMGMGGSSGSADTGRLRQSWESEDDGLWDPSGDGAFSADVPGIGGDGMIGGVGADFGAMEGIGAGGLGPGGGLVAGGGLGGGSTVADSAAADGGMMPFMGGGAGAGDQDRNSRQRQAWMNEDADVWAPGEHSVPPVIG